MKEIGIIILFILKVSLCCVDPNQITILPPFHDKTFIQSNIGDDLNIICCHPDGADSLTWQNAAKNEIVYKSSNGVFSLKDEKNRLILRIDNIDKSKTGEYTCIHNSRSLSKSITITAKASQLKPAIIEKLILFPNNKLIQIKCPLTNKQGFNGWIFSRNGKKHVTTKAGGDGSFTVSEDKSLFTLNTNNGKSSITMVWCQFQEVDINGDVKTGLYEFTWRSYDPIDIKLTVDHDGPIVEGSTVKMTCTFKYQGEMSVAFPDKMRIKSNMLLNTDKLMSGKVVLTVKKITKESAGEYRCVITKFIDLTTMLLVEEVASVNIDIVQPPKITGNDFINRPAKLNEDASLVCQIQGKPLTEKDVYFEHYIRDNSQWKRLNDNGEKYSIKFIDGERSSLNLTIKKVSWDDRGKYRCVAKNAIGEDKQIGLMRVEKSPELMTSVATIYMSTTPAKIDCILSGYPIYPSEDVLELQVVSKSAALTVNLKSRQNDDIDRFSVSYEIISQGELTAGGPFKLQCYHRNLRTNLITTKIIELRTAEKPDIPTVSMVCSGSSGIVFMYSLPKTNDKSKILVKNVLTYAPSEDFESTTTKPFIVIPVKENESAERLVYVLKDLVASRSYTFKWEGFNVYGLSNERTMTYRTKNIMLPPTPETLVFWPSQNVINANISWKDECPYVGSNSEIMDISVTMKPYEVEDRENNVMQWVERNFTIDVSNSSAHFFISLENPQIDYEIQVAMRSALGSSRPLTSIYRAKVVLGSLFSSFPGGAASMLTWNISLIHGTLYLIAVLMMRLY